MYQGINLAYGRKTGHGGTNAKELYRGARVFEITKYPFKIETWVRQEDGTVLRETQSKYRVDKGEQPQLMGFETKIKFDKIN